MVRPTVPVTDLRALRYICRSPCGMATGGDLHSHPAGAHHINSPMDVKTKGDKVEHQRPPSGVHKKEKEQ